jgi:hypothetical protein
MDLTLSKQDSMYFRCESNNKTPVPINTEEFLDQPNFLPWDYYLLTRYGLNKMDFVWFIAQLSHPFRQFKPLAIVPLMQVHLRVSGVPG